MKKISTITGIIIILAAAVLLFGGVFAYKNYFNLKRELQNNKTADWKTYINSEYGFEIKYPEELETRQRTISGDCVKGEEIRFYFYKKGEAPPNIPGHGTGSYLFEGSLNSPDYDTTSCPLGFTPPQIILNPPFRLSSTSLNVSVDVQSSSCLISQTAKYDVEKYYNKKYNTFILNLYSLDSLNIVEGGAETREDCREQFKKNIQKLKPKIEIFDSVSNSLKFQIYPS